MSISSPGSQGSSITELVAARLAARSAAPSRVASPNVVPAGPALAARNAAAGAAAYGLERKPREPQGDQAVVIETSRGAVATAPIQASNSEEESGQQSPPGLTRPQVEELAQRYLHAIGKPERASDPQEIKKLADFYGANPERSERLNTLVAGLEGDGSPVESGTVAVA